MVTKFGAFAAAVLLFAAPLTAEAGEFDGTRDVICTTDRGVAYHGDDRQRPFNPESVGLPREFVVAFEARRIRPTPQSVIQRSTRIERLQVVEDKLMLQGVNDGLEGVSDGVGWSMAIVQTTGRFVVAASGGGVGYVVFGRCSASRVP